MSKITSMDKEEFTCCLRKRQMGNMVRCMVLATKEIRHDALVEFRTGTMCPTYGVRGRRRLETRS